MRNSLARLDSCPDPDYFPYLARAPWPAIVDLGNNLDWVAAVDSVESWLEARVGSRLAAWQWAPSSPQAYWQCAVSFHWDRDRSLFLLTWA
jgi:hypothetical protein